MNYNSFICLYLSMSIFYLCKSFWTKVTNQNRLKYDLTGTNNNNEYSYQTQTNWRIHANAKIKHKIITQKNQLKYIAASLIDISRGIRKNFFRFLRILKQIIVSSRGKLYFKKLLEFQPRFNGPLDKNFQNAYFCRASARVPWNAGVVRENGRWVHVRRSNCQNPHCTYAFGNFSNMAALPPTVIEQCMKKCLGRWVSVSHVRRSNCQNLFSSVFALMHLEIIAVWQPYSRHL